MSYKLLSYQSGREARAGILVGDQVYDAARLTGQAAWSSVLGALQDWSKAHRAFAAAAKRIEPGCVRDESSVHRESDRDRTGSSHRPASDIAMTTTMKTTITSSAIFHGLLGYSPAIAPVTPFIAH